MKIESVELIENDFGVLYFVNGKYNVPIDENNVIYQEVLEYLDGSN